MKKQVCLLLGLFSVFAVSAQEKEKSKKQVEKANFRVPWKPLIFTPGRNWRMREANNNHNVFDIIRYKTIANRPPPIQGKRSDSILSYLTHFSVTYLPIVTN